MPVFQLFRIKVFLSRQRSFFDSDDSRSSLLMRSINSLPLLEFREGLAWHIGNITTLDDSGLYFRLGRTSKSNIDMYNEEKGFFVDEEFETAPYTHVIVDVDLELCAIAKKPKLAPSSLGIARQFTKLLNKSEIATQRTVSFEIDELKDPKDFNFHLDNAFSISKYWLQFTRPNPFDTNEDFIKPLQKALNEANGERGKTELRGSELDSETLKKLTNSAAATGDDAGASMKLTRTGKTVNKQLKGNPVNLEEEDIADDNQKQNLLQRIRQLYRQIRGNVE